MRNPTRVLIVSAAHMNNIGDDLVATIASAIFQNHIKRCNIRYATISEDKTVVLNEVKNADIVVIGGGGVIYDVSGRENVDNYISFLEFAHYMDKPTAIIGVGVQGIETEYGRRRYGEILSGVNLITARDEKDAIILSNIVNKTIPIHTTKDLAFLLPQFIESIKSSNKIELPKGIEDLGGIKHDLQKPLLGVSLSSEFSVLDKGYGAKKEIEMTNYDKSKIEFIKRLSTKYTPILLQHSEDDKKLYDSLLKSIPSAKLIKLRFDNVVTAMDAYNAFDLVVTSRYHGVILSALAGKPTIILDGENCDKIHKLLDTTLSCMKDNLFNEARINSLDISRIDDKFIFNTECREQVNKAIIESNNNNLLVESFLIGLGLI